MAIQEIFDAFEIQYCKLTDTQVRRQNATFQNLAGHPVLPLPLPCHVLS